MADATYRGPLAGYVLTEEDMIWFARALGGETWGKADRQDAQWHFWCWMDRFHLVRGNWQGPTGIPKFNGFGSLLVQWHSTSTSPRWASPNTTKCQQWPDSCTPAQIDNRAKWTHATKEQLIEWKMWKYAVEAAAGTLERPIDRALYNFASCRLTGKQSRPCPGIEFGGQCFIDLKCLNTSIDGALVLNDDGTVPGAVTVSGTVSSIAKTTAKTTLGVLFGVAVLWAAWTLYSKRKG